MNADKFFQEHTIEEINQKTRISPISLKYIKNREFDKITRVKFLGFINIIEKEYNVDLSELIQEYNSKGNTNTKDDKPQKQNKTKPPVNKSKKPVMLIVLTLILLALGGYLLYKNYNTKQTDKNLTVIYSYTNSTSSSQPTIIETPKDSNSGNITNEPVINNEPIIVEQNTTKEENKTKSIPKDIVIIPNEKVWFRAKNLDNNRTLEFLTQKQQILVGPNWYVKFGHGDITVQYGDQNITPATKKIVRILFKDGNVTFLNKNNRYEK